MAETIKPIQIERLSARRTLTLEEAAQLLNVDRDYLIRLLDAKEIPATGKAELRRLRREDVLAYKAKRDAERRASLNKLTELSEDAGLYNADYRSTITPS
jgi:excisionase family DNA binding protein